MKRFKGLTVVLAGLFLMAGCGMANGGNEAGEDNNNLQPENVGYNNGNNANDMNGPYNKDNGMSGDNMNNGEGRMESSEKAAKKVNELKEVKQANVIMTENNAFVAVMLEDNSEGEVTKDVEKKVAKAVRDTEQNIENVYVSSNPDFVERMRGYGDDLQNGKPVEGLFEEFGEMTRRIFPNAR
ncbi:YhcN/YlaJ family sporulation lipoprotein [Bacillus sp. P14.5]|uniref:YhcN/YlaJ family sporulation lipoprotein n=1 Tax=Bacillus sp. P14.5 TaxID=1983400 RepID=UPI000DE96357|nr:YhcN/YlaJ family sporulation lipoprotein [Bacillus sp. P14.5]